MQGGTVCDTKDGAKDSFHVLRVPYQDDKEDVEEDGRLTCFGLLRVRLFGWLKSLPG